MELVFIHSPVNHSLLFIASDSLRIRWFPFFIMYPPLPLLMLWVSIEGRSLPLLVLWASIEGRFTNKRDEIEYKVQKRFDGGTKISLPLLVLWASIEGRFTNKRIEIEYQV